MEETKKENDKTQKKIELRSPAVQEILGRPPRWVIRWGITVILIIIGGIIIGSFFFKYPDIISAPIEVNTQNLPAQLVSKASGKLDSVFITDHQILKSGQYIALIENTANFEDVVKLKEQIQNFHPLLINQPQNLVFKVDNNLKLGELQNPYYQFIKAWEDYQYFVKANYHNQKISALQKQISIQQKLAQITQKQSKISQQQLQAQERLFAIDSNLYSKKSITLIEFENAKNTLLNTQQSYENSLASVDNFQLTIAQYEQNIFDLQQQAEDKKKELILALSGGCESLQSQISQWEMQYVFISPIEGKISLSKSWQKNQFTSSGEIFANIVPLETTRINGKILLPSKGSGKVKQGQMVNVKFEGFPHMEYGMVRGVVKSISLVPMVIDKEKFTMVEVEFPNNLKTNYGKDLDFSQSMSGTAEIITEDMRLMERFLNPIKSLIKR